MHTLTPQWHRCHGSILPLNHCRWLIADACAFGRCLLWGQWCMCVALYMCARAHVQVRASACKCVCVCVCVGGIVIATRALPCARGTAAHGVRRASRAVSCVTHYFVSSKRCFAFLFRDRECTRLRAHTRTRARVAGADTASATNDADPPVLDMGHFQVLPDKLNLIRNLIISAASFSTMSRQKKNTHK